MPLPDRIFVLRINSDFTPIHVTDVRLWQMQPAGVSLRNLHGYKINQILSPAV